MIHPSGLVNRFLFILSFFIFLYEKGGAPLFSSSFHLWAQTLWSALTTRAALFKCSPSSFFFSLFNFPQCFDCKSDLGGSKAGAEVRIRNKQLYCNLCYMQFKSELLISLTSVVPCYFWLFFFFFMKNPDLSPLFQLANQPPCDVTVLQQIEEETCGDGNPWTLTRGAIANSRDTWIGHTFIYDSRKLSNKIYVGWEGRGLFHVWFRGDAWKTVLCFYVFMICLSITAVQSVWVQHAAELFNDCSHETSPEVNCL